ncbi:MAG: hypothetical protein ACRC10_05540 [Thermoguttaceae bacterium]
MGNGRFYDDFGKLGLPVESLEEYGHIVTFRNCRISVLPKGEEKWLVFEPKRDNARPDWLLNTKPIEDKYYTEEEFKEALTKWEIEYEEAWETNYQLLKNDCLVAAFSSVQKIIGEFYISVKTGRLLTIWYKDPKRGWIECINQLATFTGGQSRPVDTGMLYAPGLLTGTAFSLGGKTYLISGTIENDISRVQLLEKIKVELVIKGNELRIYKNNELVTTQKTEKLGYQSVQTVSHADTITHNLDSLVISSTKDNESPVSVVSGKSLAGLFADTTIGDYSWETELPNRIVPLEHSEQSVTVLAHNEWTVVETPGIKEPNPTYNPYNAMDVNTRIIERSGYAIFILAHPTESYNRIIVVFNKKTKEVVTRKIPAESTFVGYSVSSPHLYPNIHDSAAVFSVYDWYRTRLSQTNTPRAADKTIELDCVGIHYAIGEVFRISVPLLLYGRYTQVFAGDRIEEYNKPVFGEIDYGDSEPNYPAVLPRILTPAPVSGAYYTVPVGLNLPTKFELRDRYDFNTNRTYYASEADAGVGSIALETRHKNGTKLFTHYVGASVSVVAGYNYDEQKYTGTAHYTPQYPPSLRSRYGVNSNTIGVAGNSRWICEDNVPIYLLVHNVCLSASSTEKTRLCFLEDKKIDMDSTDNVVGMAGNYVTFVNRDSFWYDENLTIVETGIAGTHYFTAFSGHYALCEGKVFYKGNQTDSVENAFYLFSTNYNTPIALSSENWYAILYDNVIPDYRFGNHIFTGLSVVYEGIVVYRNEDAAVGVKWNFNDNTVLSSNVYVHPTGRYAICLYSDSLLYNSTRRVVAVYLDKVIEDEKLGSIPFLSPTARYFVHNNRVWLDGVEIRDTSVDPSEYESIVTTGEEHEGTLSLIIEFKHLGGTVTTRSYLCLGDSESQRFDYLITKESKSHTKLKPQASEDITIGQTWATDAIISDYQARRDNPFGFSGDSSDFTDLNPILIDGE